MKSTFVMAQMAVDADPTANLRKARAMTEQAVQDYGADLVIFPEVMMSVFPSDSTIQERNAVGEDLDGQFVQELTEIAKASGVWLVFGMKEQSNLADETRVYNTSVVLNSEGEIVATYRKTHLYDAFGYKESDEYLPGDGLFQPIDTPFGKLGMFVCYELRFPEIARDQAVKGAEIILVPTMWFKGDLKAHHFHTLTTSRALENTVFVLACDQALGTSLGESIAVDPMGVRTAAGTETEGLIPVFIDTDRIAEVRKKLPSYANRRPELY